MMPNDALTVIYYCIFINALNGQKSICDENYAFAAWYPIPKLRTQPQSCTKNNKKAESGVWGLARGGGGGGLILRELWAAGWCQR